VIACRITAENPEQNFQPTSGMIQELNFRSTPDVWGYFSIGALGGVHEYADSQFGHLFAVGETREIARRNMVLALKELSIRVRFEWKQCIDSLFRVKFELRLSICIRFWKLKITKRIRLIRLG
jgi:biotin carboxylase